MSAFTFIIMVLAAWRITHLFSMEDGPFAVIYRLRKMAGNGFFGKLLDCFYCTSVWVALPFGLYTGISWHEKILYWIAFSGAVCLLEQATTSNKSKTPVMPDYTEE